MNIFIDDERIAPKDYRSFKTGEQFIQFISRHTTDNKLTVNIDNISLDHDLGEGMSGYELVKTLIYDYPYVFDSIKNIYVHSNNTIGRQNIKGILINAVVHRAIPFSNIYLHFAKYSKGKLVDELTGLQLA